MDKENIKTPSNMLARMQVVHFGKILFNLQFIALVVMIFSVATLLLVPLYYLVLLAVSLITLFTVYVIYPEFSSLWALGETFTEFAVKISQSWVYTVPILAVLSAASIVCLCMDKSYKHTARIAVSGVVLGIAAIVLIVKLAIGSGAVTV